MFQLSLYSFYSGNDKQLTFILTFIRTFGLVLEHHTRKTGPRRCSEVASLRVLSSHERCQVDARITVLGSVRKGGLKIMG